MAAVIVCAAFISEDSENTSNNPTMKLCALLLVVANYATLCNPVHRVAVSVHKFLTPHSTNREPRRTCKQAKTTLSRVRLVG